MVGDPLQILIWFRLIERGTLTVFVLLASVWLVLRYVNQITKIQFSSEKLLVSTISVAIGTPILIVLLFVGYAYVDLSNPIAYSDLLNPTEVGPAGSPPQRPGSVSRSFRGLGANAERHAQAEHPAADAAQQPSSAGLAERTFALWTENNLRLAFVSLVSKAQPPLTPDTASKVLRLALAVGCLNAETNAIPRSFDDFTANKDFRRIEADVTDALKSHFFYNALCTALQQEL